MRPTSIAFRCCGPKNERSWNVRSRSGAFGTEIKLDPSGKRVWWNIASLAILAYSHSSDSSVPQFSFSFHSFDQYTRWSAVSYPFCSTDGNFSATYKFCSPIGCRLPRNTKQGRIPWNILISVVFNNAPWKYTKDICNATVSPCYKIAKQWWSPSQWFYKCLLDANEEVFSRV